MIWNLNYDLISQFQIGLKSLLRQGPEFYDDLVYKLKKIVGSNIFSAQFIKIISNKKKIGCNIYVMKQIHAWWPTQSRLATLLDFNCMPVDRTSDAMTVLTLKYLSINKMVGGLMLWLLSGSPRFICRISFALVFSFINCWVLIFLYLDLYVPGDDALIS